MTCIVPSHQTPCLLTTYYNLCTVLHPPRFRHHPILLFHTHLFESISTISCAHHTYTLTIHRFLVSSPFLAALPQRTCLEGMSNPKTYVEMPRLPKHYTCSQVSQNVTTEAVGADPISLVVESDELPPTLESSMSYLSGDEPHFSCTPLGGGHTRSPVYVKLHVEQQSRRRFSTYPFRFGCLPRNLPSGRLSLMQKSCLHKTYSCSGVMVCIPFSQ